MLKLKITTFRILRIIFQTSNFKRNQIICIQTQFRDQNIGKISFFAD